MMSTPGLQSWLARVSTTPALFDELRADWSAFAARHGCPEAIARELRRIASGLAVSVDHNLSKRDRHLGWVIPYSFALINKDPEAHALTHRYLAEVTPVEAVGTFPGLSDTDRLLDFLDGRLRDPVLVDLARFEWQLRELRFRGRVAPSPRGAAAGPALVQPSALRVFDHRVDEIYTRVLSGTYEGGPHPRSRHAYAFWWTPSTGPRSCAVPEAAHRVLAAFTADRALDEVAKVSGVPVAGVRRVVDWGRAQGLVVG
jgi:hypothetical protein